MAPHWSIPGYSTCVSVCVCAPAKWCTAQSGQMENRSNENEEEESKQARMSILSINLLPKWVIEIHFHGEQKSFNQVPPATKWAET